MTDYGIDPHSEYSLYDILEQDFDPVEDDFHFEYYGFHIVPQGSGRYAVQYDGHVGQVMTFHREDYDDVLELVADLNDLRWQEREFIEASGEFDHEAYREKMVDWAGKLMTRDPDRAEEDPDTYVHVPEPA